MSLITHDRLHDTVLSWTLGHDHVKRSLPDFFRWRSTGSFRKFSSNSNQPDEAIAGSSVSSCLGGAAP